jgi:tetratricopeptide (TPR) repeat protein
LRGAIYYDLHALGETDRGLRTLEAATDDLEASLSLQRDIPYVRWLLSDCYNERARELAACPEPRRDLACALAMCRRALDLAPGEALPLNTLGIVQYRAGRYEEAIAAFERSLAAGSGLSDGFDLFFLAMAHHRLRHGEEARRYFDRGLQWLGNQHGMRERDARELAAFRSEAQAVLAGPAGELPDNVFAPTGASGQPRSPSGR